MSKKFNKISRFRLTNIISEQKKKSEKPQSPPDRDTSSARVIIGLKGAFWLNYQTKTFSSRDNFKQTQIGKKWNPSGIISFTFTMKMTIWWSFFRLLMYSENLDQKFFFKNLILIMSLTQLIST